jgi:uncharacterized protein DUF6166
MTIYRGKRALGVGTVPGSVTITDDDGTRPLTPRWNWCEFNWGYCGSGPRHLAYALLADATSNDDLAANHCAAFRDDVVSYLSDDWQMTAEKVRNWCRGLQGNEAD